MEGYQEIEELHSFPSVDFCMCSSLCLACASL